MTMTLQCLGATGEVTGSCHLLELNGAQLLLDCGLIQGGKKDELRNHEPFAFDPHTITAVVLSHAHIDHSGRLPLLMKRGYDGPIYTQKATAELCAFMLRDAASLQQRQLERENEKRLKQDLPPLVPLFDEQDVDMVLQHFVPLEYGVRFEPVPGISVCLSDAGHILGSAILELWLDDGTCQKKLVFSGDLGRAGMPILRDPTLIDDADLVLMESTYGDRCHRSWQATIDELKAIFAKALSESRGNILIPAFSVGRAQELLYLFHLYAKEWDLSRWQICLDSPMAIEATKVYVRNYPLMDEDFRHFVQFNPGNHPLLSKVQFIQSTEESKALNHIHQGLIIIAGSGMCNGGRIRSHLAHNLFRSECDIIICGFQARGTPGRLLVDGATELTVHGESVPVNALIHTVGGLSAHADQQELLRWYRHFNNAPPLLLVHGEPTAQETLQQVLREEGNAEVVIVNLADKMDLTQLPHLAWLN
ncbi:MBL fold metallo-hydrolase RNA specificity domain-containing protein [Shewanella dokdonensis]|uniref:MBL fold metallo-hydrolase n=1 Tax=Shewanella dokdonensis TaxID=712036 RepID=A0ABX8DHN0_9GAMM|nr:MBL fold metallo-hydrolase [Shewanella dokdonensis]MCL1075879.1 MBL fold metallo-hydrolase [Shewanella dokdonensis]QVK24205.1 MBL fold metallo-hydrolase [Shewanella dokdonensis]